MEPKKVWDFDDAIEVLKDYHKTEVLEKDTLIEKLEESIIEKDDLIRDMQKQFDEKDEEAQALASELDKAKNEIGDLKKKVADLETRLDAAEA
jgi:chromosome segregation ATPase